MSFTVDAIYEGGLLKPIVPLPFKEHEKVRLTVEPTTSVSRQTAGMLQWSGDEETLRRIAEDTEFGIREAP